MNNQFAVVAVSRNGVRLKSRKFYNRSANGMRELGTLSTSTRLYDRAGAQLRATQVARQSAAFKGYEFGIVPVTSTTTLTAGKVLSPAEILKASALAKLTADEKKALGL